MGPELLAFLLLAGAGAVIITVALLVSRNTKATTDDSDPPTAPMASQGTPGTVNHEHAPGGREREDEGSGRVWMLGILGLGSCLVGLRYLLDPSTGDSTIANLHALAIGQTFFLAGAMFLAAAIRPRGR